MKGLLIDAGTITAIGTALAAVLGGMARLVRAVRDDGCDCSAHDDSLDKEAARG